MKPLAGRNLVVRAGTLGLAFVHTFPARGHLTELVAHPSLAEAWKGLGALVATIFYLLPPSTQARALSHLWARRRALVGAMGLLLAAAHAVPAADHLPHLFDHGTFHDAWRGLGSALAVIWFLAPVPLQARALSRLWIRRGVWRDHATVDGELSLAESD
jgi:hypothetical protein